MKNKEKVIFFGSGDFPRETFLYLIDMQKEANANYEIVGIVTSHDKCEDKGEHLSEIAEQNHIPYISVKDCNNAMLYEWCSMKKPTMFIVISFKKIPTSLLNIVNNRAFNIHASILPFLRGANPIRWAIRNNFSSTGLTAITLSDKIDNGNILANTHTNIDEDSTYGSLKAKLSSLSPQLTYRVLTEFDELCKTSIQQSNCGCDDMIFYAPKLDRNYCKIYHGGTTKSILNSLLPYNGLRCKIYVYERYDTSDTAIGFKYQRLENIDCTIWNIEWHTDGDDIRSHICNNGNYTGWNATEIQIDGKKRMSFNDFINGFKYAKPNTEDKGLKFKKYNFEIELL